MKPGFFTFAKFGNGCSPRPDRLASKPGTWLMRQSAHGSQFIPVALEEASPDGGFQIYRFGSPLYFANAGKFLEDVSSIVEGGTRSVKCLVLDAQAMTDMDTTGAESFHEAMQLLAGRNIVLAVSRANRALEKLLRHYGYDEQIGRDRMYPTNRHALAAWRREQSETDSHMA